MKTSLGVPRHFPGQASRVTSHAPIFFYMYRYSVYRYSVVPIYIKLLFLRYFLVNAVLRRNNLTANAVYSHVLTSYDLQFHQMIYVRIKTVPCRLFSKKLWIFCVTFPARPHECESIWCLLIYFIESSSHRSGQHLQHALFRFLVPGAAPGSYEFALRICIVCNPVPYATGFASAPF